MSRPAATRGVWGTVDQALSSLSNFALGLLVVRSVSVSDFGVYSLMFVTYLLLLGTHRSLFSQPFTIRVRHSAGHTRRDRGQVLGGAVVVSVGAAIVSLVVAFFVPEYSFASLAAFAASLPGLLIQDAYRLTFFALGRPREAAINDLVWTVAMFAAAAVVLLAGRASVATLVLCWGGGATIAAAVGWYQCGVLPRALRSWSYFREHRDLSVPLMGDFWAQQGALQASTYGLGLVANVVTVGVFRTVALLMGPLNLFSNALSVVALPELVRVRHRSFRALRNAVFALSVLPAVAAVVVGIALVALPEQWGVTIVGPTWGELDGVILPFALARSAGGAALGAIMGCRVLEAAAGMLRTRLIASPIIVVATLAGASFSGARGAAIGMAVSMWVAALLWWMQYRRAEQAERDACPPSTSRDRGAAASDALGP